MKYEIELKGLPAFHPASALSIYGLYSLIPNSKIRYKINSNQTYCPVLESKYQNVEELVEFLCDLQTWDNFDSEFISCTKTYLSDYEKFIDLDEALATGIATDMNLSKCDKKEKSNKMKISPDDLEVARSPFYLINRTTWNFAEQFKGVFNLMKKRPELAIRNLSKYSWEYQSGQNFGFFFESVMDKVSKNTIENKESNLLTVPVVCLLAIASLKILPCFMNNEDVLTAGWNKKDKDLHFRYPIFTRYHTQQEAVAWLHNSALLLDLSKKRSAFTKFGIPEVYEFKKFKYDGGRGGYFKSAISV